MKKNIRETAQASFSDPADQTGKALPTTSSQIRLPAQRPIAQVSSSTQRQTEQVTKEWSKEVSHTDQVSSQVSVSSEKAPGLASKRVQRFHSKKTMTVLKKMAELNESARRNIEHNVSVVAESSEQEKLEQSQDELWRDMIKPHEERQFQIGRITNYFS
ncbi:MAG: hypothetical protein KBA81_07940 [Rhabdochlamydiaceae bacterium]|nr:hypothetical protein [Rhabdochlamydiaceae bacterium]